MAAFPMHVTSDDNRGTLQVARVIGGETPPHACRSISPSDRRVEKVIIAGADHTFSSVENERRVIEMAADWFCGTLG